MDQINRPLPFKRYPQARVHPLPADLPPRGAGAGEVLSGEVAPGDVTVDVDHVARLLFYSAGVVRVAAGADGPVWFRAAPSAGNLHPTEVYVAAGNVDGMDAGLYHFAPDVFGLEELLAGDCREAMAEALAEPDLTASPLVAVVTGIPWRTAWKYAERGWRHVYWDAGTMLANLLAVAEGCRLPARVLLGFVDSTVCRLLGIDGVAEFPVAVITIGGRGAKATRRRGTLTEPRLAPTALSPEPVEFPLITRVQQAGTLSTVDQVVAWRAAAAAVPSQARVGVDAPAVCRPEPIESVVLRRGSTRRMRRAVAPAELLNWGMAVATRPLPSDAIAAGSTLLLHQLAVHAVRDVRPGLYRWVEGAAQQYRSVAENQVRRLSQRLCLDQPLGGDSVYTDFACADLQRVLNRCGDRGYRVAQLEAGVAAGRLQLAAFTLGYGGTGLTFFDEEVPAAFDTPAACMLAVSIGIPDYTAKPGGSPGRPTHLIL